MKRFFRQLLRTGVTAAFLAVLGMGCVTARSRSFAFVQMSGPQIGCHDCQADLARFRQAVRQINALKPDFVVICGDLVNRRDAMSWADFVAAKAELRMPCYCAPGNHDVGDAPTPETLRWYRGHVGRDYYSFEHKGRLFLVVNTPLWKAPVRNESETQDAWLIDTLEAAFRKRQPIFVISHDPLFMKDPDEPDASCNLPQAKRKVLLELFRHSGVVALLAGQAYYTLIQDGGGLQMAAPQTTSRNFDQQPSGFRVWQIGPDRSCQNRFVPLDSR